MKIKNLFKKDKTDINSIDKNTSTNSNLEVDTNTSTMTGTGQNTNEVDKNTRKKPKHFVLMRNFSLNKQYLLLSGLIFASSATALSMFYYYYNRNAQLDLRIESSTNIKMLSQRVSKNLQQAMFGEEAFYKLIEIDLDTLNYSLLKYKNGEIGFDKLEQDILEKIITPLEEDTKKINSNMPAFLKNKESFLVLKKQMPKLEAGLTRLAKKSDEVYLLSVQMGESQSKLVSVQSLIMGFANMRKSLLEITNSYDSDIQILEKINNDYLSIQSELIYLTEQDTFENNHLVNDINAINEIYKDLLKSVPNLLNTIKPILDNKKIASQSLNLFDSIYYDSDAIRDVSVTEKEDLALVSYGGYLFSLITILLVLLLGYTNLKEAKIRAWETKKENEDTDTAIINLMQELIPIAEGDLKARTTVTEHVTGALADRINDMAEALQKAIKNTRTTSESVSQQMIDIKNMISESSVLSKIAEQSAQNSNEASIAGANMVNLSAEKMEDARNKMQETSKRVKRLGEVSQSIGLVTDLIEEMTEKTAVLALNTQLKAAESGSDGNSFRVIAEEIRKLSEEARKSLETIRNNVQNMQSETQTVMLAIEQTTANVVEGSTLWEKAENDLKIIQEAANKIEKITLQLNDLSSQQVVKAQETETNMNELNKSISHFNI